MRTKMIQLARISLAKLFLVPVALLASSPVLAEIPGLEVNGSTISWTATGYMQVQNAETYETLCEGNQFSCTVAAGTYIVIDLSAAVRQEGVQVEEVEETITRRYTQVTNRQIQPSAFPLNKYSIRAQCTGGMIPIGGGCQGLVSDGTFSDSNFMPGSGHLAPTLRAYVCNFIDLDSNAGSEVALTAQATCVFDSDVQRLTTSE